MYTRTFVKGLLLPSVGVGVVHAKGEQDKEDCDDSKKPIRARDLPLYVEPPKCVTCSNKIDNDDGFLITTIRCARQEFQQIVGQAKIIQTEAQNLAEEVRRETEDIVSYLRQEENLLPRLGAIGLGGFAGYLLACRKGLIKKTLYSTAGASLIAAVAYPNQAKEYTEEVMCEVKKFAVIGYHFLNGADVDWKKLEKIKTPCFSQKGDGPQELPADKEKPKQLPSNDNSKDKEKKPDIESIDKPKVATKIGPEDKRSYMEKCKERGVCGAPKKKPTVNVEKSATQCDPDCTGPKRGTKLKKNESRTVPSRNASEKCQPALRQPQDQPCPPGCIPDPGKTSGPLDQSQPADASKPKEQAADPCKPKEQPMDTSKPSGTIAAPSQPSDTLVSSQQNVSKADPCPSIDNTKVAPAPSQSIADTNQLTDGGACRRQRRVVWNKAGDDQNKDASQNPGTTGGCKRHPSTGGVEGSQGSSTVAEQNMTPCPTSDKPGSDSNQVLTARDPSNPCKNDNKPTSDSNKGPAANDPCKSAIKSSSVTIMYPSPPGSADSRVIMSPHDPNGPCGRKPYQPKEVTMGENHRRKPKTLRDDNPTTHSQPRQTARFGSRRKTAHETDEP